MGSKKLVLDIRDFPPSHCFPAYISITQPYIVMLKKMLKMKEMRVNYFANSFSLSYILFFIYNSSYH